MRWLVGILLSFALACVEGPVYSHEPTKQLYASFDLDAPELAPFTHDGVTVGVGMTSGHAAVTISFASKQAATVTVESLRIAGVGARAGATVDVAPKAALPLVEHANHPGFFSVQHEVKFVPPDISLDAMVDEGVTVAVTWRVGDGSTTTTELSLQRKIAREIAWPT